MSRRPSVVPVRRQAAPRCLPLPLALSLASVFSAIPASTTAQALPQGGVAIHGQAQVTQPAANQLLVTTQNGAGTNHSAINWQSFSIGAGAGAHFAQPNAASLSINRVVTNTPSALFGSLSSNGHLVLVNQAGIAIGAGAMIDAAGFTASTLRMTDADAIAGRLRFGDAGVLGSAALTVEGQILARHGDVVLIAPQLETGGSALLQSPQGATVLAAGQQVEITGRGLEGIRLVVQAPEHEARNLGTLTGDAVGIFAGTLRHSGQISATTAALEGGQVVLKAAGDAYVEGQGSITATGARGGQVDVLGRRVAIADQAVVDVSGAQGGGSIRVGGDYQGGNAAIPNAERTYVGPQVVLRADATQHGDGGRVIVWADEQTQAYGTVSARGGVSGGDGGFVEMSGKHRLHFDAVVDTRAPEGRTGTLLLDPDYIDIQLTGTTYPGGGVAFADFGSGTLTLSASSISNALSNVVLQANEDINFNAAISMVQPGVGILAQAGGYLNVQAPIVTLGGSVTLSSGDPGSLTSPNEGSLNVLATIDTTGGGAVPAGANVTLHGYIADVGGNSIYVAAPINAGGSTIVLNAPDGRVEQNSGGTLRAANLVAVADYEIDLQQAANEISGGVTLTTNTATSGTGAVAFYNLSGFTVHGASAKNGVTLTGSSAIVTDGAITSLLGDVSLSADFDIQLGGDVTAGGALLASSETGRITQQAGTVSVAGSTYLSADGRIQFLAGQATNSFGGPLTVGSNDAVVIAANSALNFASLGVGTNGELILYADGGVLTLPAGAIDVGSGSLLLSSAGAFSTSGALTTTGQMHLSAGGNLNIGHNLTAGTLQLSSNGSIVQTAGRIAATGLTQATSGAADVTLMSATNDFASLYLVGRDVAVRDANAVELAGANINSSLGVTASGNITQSAAVVVSGSTTLNAGAGNVVMTTAGNNLNVLDVAGNAIDIVEGAGSALTVVGLVSGANQAVSLTAGHNLTILAAINTGTAALSLSGLSIDVGAASGLAGGNIFLSATESITLDANVTAQGTFTATSTSGAGTFAVHKIVQSGGAMTVDVGGALQVAATGGTAAALRSSGVQAIDAQSITVQAGPSGTAVIEDNSGGTQSIYSDTFINVLGASSGSNNHAQIRSVGSQVLSANSYTLSGGGGTVGNYAAIRQAGTGNHSQTVDVRSGGTVTIAGGSSSATGLSSGIDGSFAGIQAHGTGGQTLNFLSGGMLLVGGGSVGGGNYAEVWTENGPQVVTGTAQIFLTGGSGGGDLEDNSNGAFLGADLGSQTLSAQRIQLLGGAGGTGNAALILAEGQQNITVGTGGVQISGGGGTGSDTTNLAAILQVGTGAGRGQTLTLQGGDLTMAGGSSAATGVGLVTGVDAPPNLGAGSSALIRSDGADGQLIEFTSAGNTISMTGGSVGSRNEAGIEAWGGSQTIRGSSAGTAPSLQMTAGGGGSSGEGNMARIISHAGVQSLSLAAASLSAGNAVGTDGAALIVGAQQSIAVQGNLFIDGGTAVITNGGARIGGRGADNTNLTLQVGGDLLMSAGANAVSLGSSPSVTGRTNTIDATVGGDILLTASATQNVRIGSPSADLQTGAIDLSAGGDITMTGSGGSGAVVIRTLGDVTLHAGSGSIAQDSSALILSGTLAAIAHSGVQLVGPGNNVAHVYLGNSSSGAITYSGAAGVATTFSGVDQFAGGSVSLFVDDIGMTGPINAIGGTVTIAAASASRSVRIEDAPTAGVLSLTPGELSLVNASDLRIGRFDGTGTVTLAALVGSLGVNTLQLWNGGDIVGLAGASLGSAGAELGSAVELRTSGNILLSGIGVYLADNRTFALQADQEGNNAGNVAISDAQIRVGTTGANTSGGMYISGVQVDVTNTGAGGTVLRVEGSGAQSLQAAQSLQILNGSSTGGGLQVSTASGAQSLVAGTQIAVGAGTGTGTSAVVASGGAQTVDALGLSVMGGSAGGGTGTGNKAVLQAEGNQTLSIGSLGVVISGGGGSLSDNYALVIQNGAAGQQELYLSGGGSLALQGGSSSGSGTGGFGHGSFAALQSNGSAQILVLDGGAVQLTGGTNGSRNLASIWASAGNQSVTGASTIIVAGGASGGVDQFGNSADISASGTQSISASTITIQGGAGGQENEARINSTGDQTISAMGMTLAGGSGGGGFDTGNRALVRSVANQTLTLGAGGLSIAGGGGSLSDNAALVLQDGTGAATQTITIGTGGHLVLTGGDSTQTNVGGSGHGSRALIQALGASQTITLLGGNVTLTGGSAGSRAFAQIYAENGAQSLTGVGALQLRGGTGGVAGEGNFARIHAQSALQTIGAGSVLLTGGGAGTENYAALLAPTQQISVSGGLSLQGATAAGTGHGARIGGLGEASTDLTLVVGGSVALQAGVGSGVTLGGTVTSAPSGQTSHIDLTAGGDIILAPLGSFGVVIGAGSPNFLPGALDITSTSGNIVMQGSGSTGRAGIASLGNVSLTAAGNISQSSEAGLLADQLTLSAGGSIFMPAANAANSLVATSGADLLFTNNRALALGSIVTGGGTGTVQISTTGAASHLTVNGASSTNDDWQLSAGGNLTLAGAVSGANIVLSAGGSLLLSANLSASGDLELAASSSGIAQTAGAITAAGLTTLTSAEPVGDITLTGAANDFQSVTAYGGTVRIRDVNGITLNDFDTTALVVQAGGDLNVMGALHATRTGDAVALATTGMVLSVDADASISTPNGRWLLYAAAPGQTTLGNLVYDFKQYGATPVSTILGAGNGLMYGNTPSATATLVGPLSKVYDGSTDIAVVPAHFNVGSIDGDVVTLAVSQPGVLDTKNVGTGKTVTVGGLSVAGVTNGGRPVFGYDALVAPAVAAVGTVTPATVSIVGLDAADRTYDATTAASASWTSLVGIVPGDVVSLGIGSAAFDTKNVGVNKTVTVSGLSLLGADALNYVLGGGSSATVQATITPATISAVSGITALDKVYDATTAASLVTSGAVFGGMFTGDVLTVATAAGSFADKHAGTGKVVGISGITLGGTDAGNYVLAGSTASTTANITPAAISSISGFTVSKVYDATTAIGAGATISGTPVFAGLFSGDVVTLAALTGDYADKNVGTGKALSLTAVTLGGADGANYQFAGAATGSGVITPAAISAVSGITAADRVYDATTNATLLTAGAVFGGMFAGDVLTVATATGSFADKHAGAGKAVGISGITLGGADAGNYVLASSTAGTTASISKAPLTLDLSGVTASGKVYDGTRTAVLDAAGATLSGVFAGDDVVKGPITGLFADKNVGTAKTISFDQLGVVGADAGNYDLGFSTVAPLSADITPRTISAISGVLGSSKIYDGNTSALLDLSGVVLAGKVNGDDLGVVAGSVQYDSRHVGARTITASLSGLNGADAGNYVLGAGATLSAGGTITQRALSTWLASGGGAWSQASNWDALPDGNNVAAVRIPAGSGSILMDVADVGISSLQSARPLQQGAGSFLTSVLLLELQGGASLTGNNRIGALSATNGGSGDITLDNTGTLLLGVMDNSAGSITIRNTGAVVTSAQVKANVDVRISAFSPLTVGSGGVAAGNDIVLSAGTGSDPGPTDNLTLNGPLAAGNTVSLFAGNALVQNGTVFGANGVTAQALGSFSYGPLASTGNAPVRYTVQGREVVAPTGSSAQAVSVGVTGVTQTDTTLKELTGGGTPTDVQKERDKDKEAIVAEGEICK